MILPGIPAAVRRAMRADDPLPLVTQLRQTIRDSGLSLNELGRRIGISQAQLSRFLRGDRTLTLPAAAKVCHYFGLELCPRTAHTTGGEGKASDPHEPSRTRKRPR
jgi:transcriptional regulator with XRE-family HTH domain